MDVFFKIVKSFIEVDRLALQGSDKGTVFLVIDNWNDYSFRTAFRVVYLNPNGETNNIGDLKIAFFGQTADTPTSNSLPSTFQTLDDRFFSAGTDPSFYANLLEKLTPETAKLVLRALNDVAFDLSLLERAKEEEVFKISIARFVKYKSIKEQFNRIINEDDKLTKYSFSIKAADSQVLDFNVDPTSIIPTNIHVLIGSNGSGKTTLLKNMISGYLGLSLETVISYGEGFSSDGFYDLIYISFSFFDFPIHDENKTDWLVGSYRYIGASSNGRIDNDHQIRSKFCKDFRDSLAICFETRVKRDRWLNYFKNLPLDGAFEEHEIQYILDEKDKNTWSTFVDSLFDKLSSGHKIILLIFTQLIEQLEEKTLVIIDEPETHLHPPLLSALIRVISALLQEMNGVAVIATHSPVVLQEVPKSNVWYASRYGSCTKYERPLRETFGENVGILTHDVFKLESSKAGYQNLLKKLVDSGQNYEQIIDSLGGKLGGDGRVFVRSYIEQKGK